MEVRAAALRGNLARIRTSVGPGVRLVPMVKADAYGTGVAGAVAALEREDPWGFGVAAVEEGIALRRLGVDRPVWVLSPAPPGSERAAVEARLTPSISDLPSLARMRAAAAGAAPAFHLEVDTGMGRAGFDPRDVDRWAEAAHEAHRSGVRWEATFTHLHSADEGGDTIEEQWRRFQAAVQRAAPPEDSFVHALNSAGALRCPRYAAGAVRPGIFLYGGRAGAELPAPEEVAAVRARVVHVRDAPAGTTVGYGATYRSGRDERWGTLAIGYGDGFPRSLGNRGSALLRGRRVPIVGRISMDVTVVDITDVPGVETGEVATLVGADGGAHITVDEVAELAGTISYEVLTGFTPRVPRIWLDDETRH